MAEEAYRLDAVQAERAAWYPVAHRWVSSWQGEELAVVFEYRGADIAGLNAPAIAVSAPQVTPDPAVWAAPSGPDSYVEAEKEAFAEADPQTQAAIESLVAGVDDASPGHAGGTDEVV